MISSMMPYSLACCEFMMKSRSTSRSMRSERLAGVPRHQVVGDFANAQNFAGMNIDVGGLSAHSAHRWLMDKNARIGQRKPLALGSRH